VFTHVEMFRRFLPRIETRTDGAKVRWVGGSGVLHVFVCGVVLEYLESGI
jgi:hypothetical protein